MAKKVNYEDHTSTGFADVTPVRDSVPADDEFIPVFRGYNKFGFRFRPVSLNRRRRDGLDEDGFEVGDPVPLTIPVRLPTLDQRIARFERAGAARQAYYDDLLAEDDFGDEFDDIPPEGLSPHEDRFSYDRADDRPKPKSAEKAPPQASPPAASTLPSDEGKA